MIEYLCIGMFVFLAAEIAGFSRWFLMLTFGNGHNMRTARRALIVATVLMIVFWPVSIGLMVLQMFALAVKGR